MPNRLLREGILTSDRVDQLDLGAELFYRRLMSVVDDYGRFDARPSILRVRCFPLRVDAVQESAIYEWLDQCKKAGLVDVYVVSGKPYLEMVDFRQGVRAKGSKYPCAPQNATHMHSTCDADASHIRAYAPVVGDGDGDGDGDGGGDGGGDERARAPARAHKFRPLAEPTSEHTGLAVSVGVDCQAEFLKYRDWINASGKRHRDEHAGFRNWLRRAGEYAREKPGRSNVYDKRAATAAAMGINAPFEEIHAEPTDITGEAKRVA